MRAVLDTNVVVSALIWGATAIAADADIIVSGDLHLLMLGA
jgi:predicted nucleic acid-binding protein